MIRPVDLNTAGLFWFFVAAGVKIGNKIIDLGLFQDIGEGWHLMAALKDLRAYLSFVESAADSGEIRPFVTAVLADGVTVLAAVVCKYCCSVTLVG
jgi:hypothetical protein